MTLHIGDGPEVQIGQTIQVWGSPWQPQYNGFETYIPPGRKGIGSKWQLIPSNTTILVTHTPPRGFFDGNREGCADLDERIDELVTPHRVIHADGSPEASSWSLTSPEAARTVDTVGVAGPWLRASVFGHFHERGRTTRTARLHNTQIGAAGSNVQMVNCAICDDSYAVVAKPSVFDIVP